jgi:hypothetical protein
MGLKAKEFVSFACLFKDVSRFIHRFKRLWITAWKAYDGMEVNLQIFWNINSRRRICWRWVFNSMHRPHYRWGTPPAVAIGYETDWATQLVWMIWKREHSLPYRDSKSDPSVIQPVASRYTYCVIPHLHAWMRGGKTPPLLTSVLDEMSGQLHALISFLQTSGAR